MTPIQLFTLTIIASAAVFAFGILVTETWTYEQGGAVGAAVIGLLASMEV